jgi:uncharacterized SAM-binding protein YcdF (DUF218 family)
MLGRKYVFESKTTRLRRILLSAALILILGTGLAASFIAYIPIYARMQKGRAAGVFYQKSPDAIAVFTGDEGRISYALDLLKKNPSSKLLISGVHAANSFQTLVEKQSDMATAEAVKSQGMQVDLDYESKNTFENVRETVEFLKANPGIEKMLIISSDYHIMRIKIIISHFMSGSKPQFYFDSVGNSYNSWKDIRKLLKESAKIARTFFLLKIMRENIVLEDLEN